MNRYWHKAYPSAVATTAGRYPPTQTAKATAPKSVTKGSLPSSAGSISRRSCTATATAASEAAYAATARPTSDRLGRSGGPSLGSLFMRPSGPVGGGGRGRLRHTPLAVD